MNDMTQEPAQDTPSECLSNPLVEALARRVRSGNTIDIRRELNELFEAGVEAGRRRDVVDFAKTGGPVFGKPVPSVVFHVDGFVLPDPPTGVRFLQGALTQGLIVEGPIGAGRGRAAEQVASLTGMRIHDGEWFSDSFPPAGVIALRPPRLSSGEFDDPNNGQGVV